MNESTPNQQPNNTPAPNRDPNQQTINDTIFQNIQGNVPPMPNNNMTIAIIGTILGLCNCFGLIAGIFAIVKASQVASKYATGDYYGAAESAKQAKTFGIVGAVLGVIGLIFAIIYYGFMGGASAMSGGY